MKTIEERAKEWGEHIFETTPYDVVDGKACVFVEDRNIADVAEESYIAGATEQKAIDIDNACIILCRYVCPHKTDDSKCLNDKCYTWKMFRRIMEESIKSTTHK